MDNNNSCGYKSGQLPPCAPLALAYVPMQSSSKPSYEAKEALIRGTLFPGLDLPFMNVVNTKDVTDIPLGELMAIAFVCYELQLYLDTHKDDSEAFETLKCMLALKREAHERYVKKYGPLSVKDLEDASSFTWVNDPWPWEYQGEGK